MVTQHALDKLYKKTQASDTIVDTTTPTGMGDACADFGEI